MRDINRIPDFLYELERIWLANPDYRLGQLIVIATRPSEPCPDVFYLEDGKMLKGLQAFEKGEPRNTKFIPYWKKFPDLIRIKYEAITVELIEEMLETIKKEDRNLVITPSSLLKLIGVPVSDRKWMSKHQKRVDKLRSILAQIREKRKIKPIEIGYRIV